MNPLILLAIQETPSLIAYFRELFHKNNPADPVPTEAEIFAAFESAFQSSLAQDAAWLAAHPEPPAA